MLLCAAKRTDAIRVSAKSCFLSRDIDDRYFHTRDTGASHFVCKQTLTGDLAGPKKKAVKI